MRQSLFTQIWNKARLNAKSEKDFGKLVDDLGAFRGLFSYKKYDPLTGKILMESEKINTLTNQSKSNLIRLISQGVSPWRGEIDPSLYKIQRMRFGNAAQYTSPIRLNYYKLDEISTRSNIPLKQPGALVTSFAGGKKSQTTIPGASKTTDVILDAYESNWTPGPNTTKVYEIATLADSEETYINPPSHSTLVVKLYKENTLVEQLYFGGDIEDEPVYTRANAGVPPVRIVSVGDPIVTPNEGGSGRDLTIDETNADECGTRLFYDYTTGATGWKLRIEEIDPELPEAPYDEIRIEYEIGKYNVINSVVPKLGYNDGSGLTELNRYQGNSDWYPVIGALEYRDGDDDFIDDFSVTFSVNMTGPQGNGDTNVNLSEYIRYTEAFLFNGLDDMFSIVYLPTPFDKNSGSAFYISWTILAPIN